MSGPPSSTREILRAFWEGASQPGMAALAGTLGVSVLWLVAGTLVFSPDLFKRADCRRWMRDEEDDIARLTALSWQARLSPPAHPVVYFIGASDLREALVDEAFFTSHLQRPNQGAVSVRALIADGMTMEEKAATLAHFGEDFPGLAVIEVGPQNLSRGKARSRQFAEHIRLGFRSPVYDDECQRMGYATRAASGVFFLDNIRFLLTRTAALKNLVRPPPEYYWHRFDRDTPLTPVQLEQKQVPLDRESLERNAGILRRMAARVREHGKAKLVLLEVPWQDQVDTAGRTARRTQELEDYQRFITGLARELRIPYVNPTTAAKLGPDDFTGYNHFGNLAARQRYSELVATALQAILSEPRSHE